MASVKKCPEELLAENAELRWRLEEAEDTLRAIGCGEVDAFVVAGPQGERVFTLKGAERPYRVLVENMSEGAATLSPDGFILYCNRRLAAILNVSLKNLLGAPLESYVTPADRSLFSALLKECSENATEKLTLVDATGQSVPVLMSCSLHDGAGDAVISVVITDIRQQKRNEEMVASERLANSIVEQAAEAIIVCDERGAIIRASRLAHELSRENPLLKQFDDLFHLRFSGSAGIFSVAAVLRGDCCRNLEVAFDGAGDQAFFFQLNAAPLTDESGGIIGCIVSLHDITGRMWAERRLKTLNLDLERRVASRTAELALTIANLEGEIAERGVAEEGLKRLNRLYRVLSQVNHAIIFTKDRELLLTEFCRIAVEDGGFLLAWVARLDERDGKVKVAAAQGATGYLAGIDISVTDDPQGLGPTGMALKTGTFSICNDFLASASTTPWHARAKAHGIRAAASIPFTLGEKVSGALTLYSDQKGFFDQQQIVLLQQMGADFSFALENIHREEWRRDTEQALWEETAERLRTVEALREKERMLIQQSRQAAMGEMIGNIAHQWRQPLNTLGLSIQEVKMMWRLGECTGEYIAENVEKSMALIQHMSQTIDDFRDYFKPDKEKTYFDVSEMVAHTVSLVQDSFRHHNLEIEVVKLDTPVVFGYRNEFAQSLLNILNNAKDALTEREIKHPKVTVTVSREGSRAVVTVADNAGGIPAEIIDKIFDPYFTTKGPRTGTGLGLFMAKTIIDRNLGGRLTVRNTGEGAEFRVEVRNEI